MLSDKIMCGLVFSVASFIDFAMPFPAEHKVLSVLNQ